MGCCVTKPSYKDKYPNPDEKHGIQQTLPETTPNVGLEQPPTPNIPQAPNHPPLYMGQLEKATKFFYQEKYAEAAQIFREHIISKGEERVQAIDGLGQIQSSLGYYEWNLFAWYKEGIESSRYIGTVYDSLSLCYLALKDDDEQIAKGIKWYQRAVDDFPQNHALMMGFANILNNKGIYQEAIDYYYKVADIKPKWVAPLECLTFIYEYRRVQKFKIIQTSNKILEIEPRNRVAMWMLARNQKDVNSKIELMKALAVMYPKYARVLNQIGIIYGNRRQYEQSISWYKKAIEIAPKYASCYNNIGVTFEILKKYPQAIEWYFKCIEKAREYNDPHNNLSDVFDRLRYTDEQIKQQMKKYSIQHDYFYYYVGLAYYGKGRMNKAMKYFMLAYECINELNKAIYKIHNSTGIAYDDMGDKQQALTYYRKCIESNPKYHSAYYNTAILYKKMNKLEETIEWYKKAIEVNPRYSYAYNNLGNIYKSQFNYQEAIKYFKKAVEHNSTYTLALTNLGICYLKLENYREAFSAMDRAQQCLPYDNNNLSQVNISFLREKLQKFEKQAENWRQNGCVTLEQKQTLKGMIKSFQSNINRLYVNQSIEPISSEKVFKPEIIQIIKLIHEDCFELTSIDRIFNLIAVIFKDNEDYFHIIPQLFMQYFYKNSFHKKRPVLQIQKELREMVKKMSIKAQEMLQAGSSFEHRSKYTNFTLKNFQPQQGLKVNIFRNVKYFTHYAQIYSQIMAANQIANKSYPQFKKLVDYVKKQCYGVLYGIGMKIPKDEKQQFKVILRIFQKMFKKQLNQERVQLLIGKIDIAIRKKQQSNKNSKHIGVGDVIHQIMIIWIKEITDIVNQRKKKGLETKCEISDLIRAKVMFETVDHLKDAIEALDQMCFLKGYQIIELDNRLAKHTTQDVVLKIQIKQAVCELQLGLKQEQSQYHFTHCIYEIERSPLGCIFGSYIFMSKGFQYPFIQNCKDIAQSLKHAESESDLKTLEAARYVVQILKEDPSAYP